MDSSDVRLTGHDRAAVFRIALLAACADEGRAERERRHLSRLAEAGGGTAAPSAASLAAASSSVGAPLRPLAYHLAVGACAADGLRSDAETRFLARLGTALGLAHPEIVTIATTVDALATAPLAALASPGAPAAASTDDSAADPERTVLRAATVNGALASLRQPIAGAAIIPLQLKLVYQIGRACRIELKRSDARSLLLAMGAGLAAQYLDYVARWLGEGVYDEGEPHDAGEPPAAAVPLGAGPLAADADGAAPVALPPLLPREIGPSAFAFAATFAVGEVARRRLSGSLPENDDVLQRAFAELLAHGATLHTRVAAQIADQAARLQPERLLAFVRSQ